jgi:hypothetical protein
VELVTANSQVVRSLVGDGRADLGVAASRPATRRTRASRETELSTTRSSAPSRPATAGPARRTITPRAFLATPMVARDPSSNARWTVEAVLAADGLTAAEPLWRRDAARRPDAMPAGAAHRCC